MTAYDLDPIGTVRRCPRGGDLYLRLTDDRERDWLATYVETAAQIAVGEADVRADAFELVATSALPDDLIELVATGELLRTRLVELVPAAVAVAR